MLKSAVSVLLVSTVAAVTIEVASTGGIDVSPLQYGLMFEDINHSGDGGIYAELIQNRAFQGANVTTEPFSSVGGAVLTVSKLSTPLSSALPNSLNVDASDSSGLIGFSNPGYWGIDVKAQLYNGSFYVIGDYSEDFTVSLVNDITNTVYASTNITSNSVAGNWTQHSFTLEPEDAASNSNNSFVLTFDSSLSDSLDFNLISLFPPTYNDRPNGLRIDLMETLKALNPSFLRMPGGNNIEGNESPARWHWNESIGPLTDRPGYEGTWGYENTMGLGLVEFLNWCVDLDMEPLLAVWSGLWLDGTVVAEADLEPYVQDALNELEFIMGDTSTTYGALRASLGYPDGWTIKYLEIGNEDNLNSGSSSYSSYRFSAFYDAIIDAYPDMVIIGSTIAYSPMPGSAGGDYHEYTRPDGFVEQYNYFDNFSTVHKTLVGEYAIIQPNDGTASDGANWSESKATWSFWIGSVSEAVFEIGLERNSDKIIGASYAPLLQNLNYYNWSPDLISFNADPSQNVLSTSYHQIKLFSNTRSTTILPSTSDTDAGPLYWVGGIDNSTSSYIFKAAVYNSTEDVPVSLSFDGLSSGSATLTVLTAPDGYSVNTVDSDVVVTTTSTITSDDGTFNFSLPDLSIALLVAS